MKQRILLILLLLGAFLSGAQDIPIGHWREHVPYRNAVGVTVVGDDIYCATSKSLFIYNKKDHSMEYLSKIDGLSDINFTAMAYNESQRCVILGYDNGSIDLLKGNDIINIPDIRLASNIIGGKTINNIYCKGKYAYLSAPFGVIALDLEREEVNETYKIGAGGIAVNVNDFTADDKNFYAATDNGIYWAPQNSPTLGFYQTWEQMETPDTAASVYTAIECWQGKLIYYTEGVGRLIAQTPFQNDFQELFDYSVYVKDLIVSKGQLLASGWTHLYVYENLNRTKYVFSRLSIADETVTIDPITACYIGDDQYFIAERNIGLIHVQDTKNLLAEKIEPNGPYTASAFTLANDGQNVWVAAGGHNIFWAASWKNDGLFCFDGATWKNYSPALGNLPEDIHDVSCVAVDPFDNKRVYAGTWGKGVIEIIDGKVTNVFNADNSPLQPRKNAPEQGEFIAGLAFDSHGTLWVANSSVDDLLLSYDRTGNWKAHNLGAEFTGGWDIMSLMVDSYNNKWIVTRDNRCLIVYNENSELKARKIRDGVGRGNIEHNIFSVAEDKNGELWIGTDDGIYIIRDISNVLRLSNGAMYPINADRPKLFWDGHTTYLLTQSTVSSITVNAANEKWCSAEKVGIYKLAPEGFPTIFHFTAENSPLFSNNILGATITDRGEVFFATDQGLISYRDEVTTGNKENKNVYAFPNPVKPDYDGPIAISGVVDMAHIKIADVSGNIVYASQARGGQAIWDAKDFNGKRVSTGVYVVYITNDDGSETTVAKIMVLN
ncbi:MAG: T9SS type A sorting domain-containing protein [Bacteroidales bacterium]|jgi:hypothetical protein|nr:T9SS type A sorting domain-containing protein [Bacteroidales bacterium]